MKTCRMFISMLTAALVVAACAPMLQAQEEDTVLAGHKSRIKELIVAGEWSEAIEAADRALTDYSYNLELYYLKAKALSEAGDSDAAISLLKRTSFAFNIPKKVPRLLAKLYFEKGDYLRALMQYRRARDEYQDDAAFLLEFASCCNLLVPTDAERYQNKPEASLYESALDDAKGLLEHAKTLPGVDEESINSLLETIKIKKRRLLDECTFGPIYVDPKTGKIIEKKIVKDKK